MFGIAISSRTYNTIGSKIRPTPEAIPLFLAYDFAKLEKRKNIKMAAIIIDKTDFVIDKSRGRTFVGKPVDFGKRAKIPSTHFGKISFPT